VQFDDGVAWAQLRKWGGRGWPRQGKTRRARQFFRILCSPNAQRGRQFGRGDGAEGVPTSGLVGEYWRYIGGGGCLDCLDCLEAAAPDRQKSITA
jgi:hypothetical protein